MLGAAGPVGALGSTATAPAPATPSAGQTSRRYLEMLDRPLADQQVRFFAAESLRDLDNESFAELMPQLTQVLKYDPLVETSPVWRLVLERALRAPLAVGVPLFWSLQVEASSNALAYARFVRLLLQLTLRVPRMVQNVFRQQLALWGKSGAFARICAVVKAAKRRGFPKAKVVEVAREELKKLAERLPARMLLPLDSRMEVGRLIPEECRVMDSAKLPLWLVFESVDPSVSAEQSPDAVDADDASADGGEEEEGEEEEEEAEGEVAERVGGEKRGEQAESKRQGEAKSGTGAQDDADLDAAIGMPTSSGDEEEHLPSPDEVLAQIAMAEGESRGSTEDDAGSPSVRLSRRLERGGGLRLLRRNTSTNAEAASTTESATTTTTTTTTTRPVIPTLRLTASIESAAPAPAAPAATMAARASSTSAHVSSSSSSSSMYFSAPLTVRDGEVVTAMSAASMPPTWFYAVEVALVRVLDDLFRGPFVVSKRYERLLADIEEDYRSPRSRIGLPSTARGRDLHSEGGAKGESHAGVGGSASGGGGRSSVTSRR